MTTKLSEPMESLLKSMGNGYEYDDFGVHGLVLEKIVMAQPAEIAKRDNLQSLLAGNLKR